MFNISALTDNYPHTLESH